MPVLSEEGLETIEANADHILSENGMEFRDNPEGLAIFKAAGCDVDGERVCFEKGFCREVVKATTPAEYTQLDRDPANSVRMSGSASVLCPLWGPTL